MNWVGLVPFALFAFLFLILPTLKIVTGAFQTPDGAFTFENIIGLNTDSIRNAYWVSIKLSLTTAIRTPGRKDVHSSYSSLSVMRRS